MSKHTVLPVEPTVVDRARQTALTERHLLSALADVEAYFLAMRHQIDLVLQPRQPVKLGKPYPLGQCLEISVAVMRAVEEGAFSDRLTPQAAAGRAAFNAFRKAGGVWRQVWGDLRGEFFQNAFQLGSLYLDVSNDTVTPTKPKVEILPFEQARLAPIADYRHFARLAARYWKHQVYPNHVLPELAPYCPLIHVEPDGVVSLRECSDYMVNMTLAKRYAPSEDFLSDPAMPEAVFQYIAQAFDKSPFRIPRTAEEGRVQALRTCKEYRDKRWYASPQRGEKINNSIQDAMRTLRQASIEKPFKEKQKETAMALPKKLVIDGKEVDYADLSDEARRNCEMIAAIDNKLVEIQRDLEIHQAARKSYVNALVETLRAESAAKKAPLN